MAFICLRRSRNTRSYVLVESYRDKEGKSRKRTLCYLGRELDATDTLDKALTHWQAAREALKRDIRAARGDRRQVLRRRLEAAEARIAVISEQVALHSKRAKAAELERLRKQREAEEAEHWRAFDRLRREPSEENAKAAKRAFLVLVKRHHPDSGGTHENFGSSAGSVGV